MGAGVSGASCGSSLERPESREEQLAEPQHEVVHVSASMVIRNSALIDAEFENASGGRRLIVRTRMAPAAAPMLAALWPSTRSFFPASLHKSTV